MTTPNSIRKAVWAGLIAALCCGSAFAGDIEPTCPTCVQSQTSETDATGLLDETLANTAEILEPDWEFLLRRRAEEAQKAGLMRQALMKTEMNLRRHAVHPVDLKLPKAQEPLTRRRVLLDAQTVSHMAEPVKAVLSGFARAYVFFNADDPAQRAFVKSLAGNASSIRPEATAGNLAEASHSMGMRLFADQGGTLTRRFDLEAVPSLVRLTFNGTEVFVRIDEIVLDDDGCAVDANGRTDNNKNNGKATP